MPGNQIKSTVDRIKGLKNVRRQIDLCIKNCQLAQDFYLSELGPFNYVDSDVMWNGVQERMDAAVEAATLAAADLTYMVDNDGFVFQYQWTIGKRGITSFAFDAAADSCVISGSDAIVQGAGVVVADNDFIRITGTTSNDGVRSLDSGSAGSTIEFFSGITDETCTTAGAQMTLISRA